MNRLLAVAVVALAVFAIPAGAAGIKGQYIEARTCDIWTGPCFANAELNLAGKNAVLGWKVDKGEFENVNLDGLGVVAVIAASDTLGVKQTGEAKAVLIVDSRANKEQRAALVRLAKREGGELLAHVVAVESAKVDLDVCKCAEGGCGLLTAGPARIETRCLEEKHDVICGNETAYYPPLAGNVKVKPAVAVEHSFSGKGVNETWNDSGRRGAYVGSFEIR
jgi:Protein of unknown function (DUF1326)